MASILLDQVLNYIESHPDEWNQETFCSSSASSPCGTTACLAGHALLLSGEWQLDKHNTFLHVQSGLSTEKFVQANSPLFGSDVGTVIVAAELLDISLGTASKLFFTIPCTADDCEHDEECEAHLNDPAQFCAYVRKTVAEAEAEA